MTPQHLVDFIHDARVSKSCITAFDSFIALNASGLTSSRFRSTGNASTSRLLTCLLSEWAATFCRLTSMACRFTLRAITAKASLFSDRIKGGRFVGNSICG